MAVEIFIARHGQNEDNANGILNGHRDLPLTELGREQARQLGEGIKELGMKFDVIYCSPLSRAKETAEIVSTILGIAQAPTVIRELIERDFGVMTGKPQEDIAVLCAPDIITAPPVTYFLCPEGAETFPQLVERGHKALEIVRAMQKSGNALLVCHGDLGKMIYAAATEKDWRDVLVGFHFGNGELIEITPKDDARVIEVPQHNS